MRSLCEASDGVAWSRAKMWRRLIALRKGQVESYDVSIASLSEEIGYPQYCGVLAEFLGDTAIALAKFGRTRDATALISRAIEGQQL